MIRVGKKTDEYEGIGRGKINIENIPLYEDKVGPFGSTTSDTERTMVTENTKKILLFVVCFGESEKEKDDELAISLFKEFADAENITKINVQ